MRADPHLPPVPRIEKLKRKVGYAMEDEMINEARKQMKSLAVTDTRQDDMQT